MPWGLGKAASTVISDVELSVPGDHLFVWFYLIYLVAQAGLKHEAIIIVHFHGQLDLT